jgi:hypothetical protein
MSTEANHVQALAAQLQDGLQGLAGDAPAVVPGVTDRVILGNRALPLGQIRQILVHSGRVFLLGGDVVFEQRSQAEGDRLVPLMQGDRLQASAPAHLAGLFCCAVGGKGSQVTYQPPAKVVAEVLTGAATRDQLPRVAWYSRRPVFGPQFQLCQPGYHPAAGVLVHGDPVAPLPATPPASERAIDRLPPGLRALLADFCFETDADLVNAVAMLLTGVLMNHLVSAGKPVFIINGNQHGVGKTLLARVAGLVLDGAEPPPVHHTQDEDELGKRLGARIRPGSPFSLLFFDNRKGKIGGGLLESLALAPRVNVRQLGANEDISRPNDFLWVFTANSARVTDDMTSRGVVIQLRYEGDPRQRFADGHTEEESLKRYALEQRGQVLGELLGMVLLWLEAGMPQPAARHRCTHWARLVGGVLQAAGLPEFLANQDQLTAEIDEELQELAGLAEDVVSRHRAGFYQEGGSPAPAGGPGRKPAEWVPVIRDAGLLQHELGNAASDRARATVVGKFLGGRLGRAVPIAVGDSAGTATLRAQQGHARQRRYWFEVSWEAAGDGSGAANAVVSNIVANITNTADGANASGGPTSPTPPTAPTPPAAPAPPTPSSPTWSPTSPTPPTAPTPPAAPASPTLPMPPPLPASPTPPAPAAAPPAAGGNDLEW